MIDTGFSMLMGGIGISSAGFPGLVTALRGPESEMEAEILLPSSLVDIGAVVDASHPASSGDSKGDAWRTTVPGATPPDRGGLARLVSPG